MNQTLANKTLVLTQPVSEKSEDFCQIFRDQGANVYHLPMIEIRPLKFKCETIQDHHFIIFTSRNGVKYFFTETDIIEKVKNSKTKIISIGEQTNSALNQLGLEVSFSPKHFNSNSLTKELDGHYKLENQQILLIQGVLAPSKIEQSLSKNNVVKRINVYETIIGNSPNREIQKLCSNQDIDYCVFTSPSGFIGFESQHKSCLGSNTKIVSIGPVTTKKINELAYKVDITAEESTYQGIYKSIIKTI